MCASNRPDAYHDTAQICLKGHIVNAESDSKPEFNEKFCSKCGVLVISACQNCGTTIIGTYRSPDIFHTDRFPDLVSVSIDKPPFFCRECGEPYPWTVEKLKAAQDVVNEDPNLTDAQKVTLNESVNDLVHETPRTPIAAKRYKTLVGKAAKETAKVLRELLVDIASEILKKTMSP